MDTQKPTRRLLSIAVAFLLVFTLVPAQVFGAEGAEANSPVEDGANAGTNTEEVVPIPETEVPDNSDEGIPTEEEDPLEGDEEGDAILMDTFALDAEEDESLAETEEDVVETLADDSFVLDGTYPDTATLQTALNAAIEAVSTSGGGTLTVTGSHTATQNLTLNIPAGVTVAWNASLTFSGLQGYALMLYGKERTDCGACIVGAGANIQATPASGNGGAISMYDSVALTVQGGTISGTGGDVYTISGNATAITVTGGLISNSGAVSRAISTAGPLNISGGTITHSGGMGYAITSYGSISVSGGTILNTDTNSSSYAVFPSTGSSLNATGGIILGRGTLLTHVVNGSSLTVTSPAVIVAWSQYDFSTHHLEDSTNNLRVVSGQGGTAVWNYVSTPAEGGVAYANGTNAGFVPLGVSIDYVRLAITLPAFDEVTAGYTQVAAQPLTITNNGNYDVDDLDVVLQGTGFTLVGGNTTLAAGASDTSWSIQPDDGLAPGSYTIDVIATDLDTTRSASATLTPFVVKESPVTPTSPTTPTTPTKPTKAPPAPAAANTLDSLATTGDSSGTLLAATAILAIAALGGLFGGRRMQQKYKSQT